jgi:LysR family transcriptional regulator, chromosome initiation inhibitor
VNATNPQRPATPTAAGIPLLRLAAQTALLEAEALAEMGGGDGAVSRIAVAVNADSMATWFTRVFGALDGVLFRYPDRGPGPLRKAVA